MNNKDFSIVLDSCSKKFQVHDTTITVVDKVSLTLKYGETLSIVGPSGSGKTTMLSLCAGLELPTSGSVFLAGHEISEMSEDQRAKIRLQYCSFVFQSFQLFPTLTAYENVRVPLELLSVSDVDARAKEMLGLVGLGDRLNHYPSQLSGGEQQRVALARAFVSKPKILFADEPTGNLDQETAGGIQQILFSLNQEHGSTLVLVTHDMELAKKTEKIISIHKGQLVE